MSDSQEFAVRIAPDEPHLVVVDGELDLITASQLKRGIDEVIEATSGDVMVDLAKVSYIDSTSLTVLLAAHDRLAAEGRRLAVVNPSSQVLRLLEICGVCHVVAPNAEAVVHDATQ